MASNNSKKNSTIFPQCYTIITSIDELTHDEWLEVRRSGIGGSDAGAIAGLSQWKTPLGVYLDKLGQAPPVEDNEIRKMGRVLEPVVADLFEEATGKRLIKFPFMLRSTQYPWMMANVDRLVVGEEAGMECKTAHTYTASKWDDGKVPDSYVLQCHHYMIVMGYKKWYIACLIGGQKFVYYEVDYNEEIAQAVIRQEQNFWKMVQDQTPPAAWGGDSDILSALYSSPKDISIVLDSDTYPLIQQYKSASAAEKIAKADKDTAKVKLCEMIGNHTRATYGDTKLSWPVVNTDRLDTDRFKKDHPDIYKRYIKTTESRRFSLK